MDILAKITEKDYQEAGVIPLGFLYASVKNVGETPVIVNSVPLAPGEAKGYPFVGKGYQEVSFDPQESTLHVMHVV